MSGFQKKEWIRRETEFPGRRLLSPTGEENIVDVTRSEGLIMEEGDAFSPENMNTLEERIASAVPNAASAEVDGGQLIVVCATPPEGPSYTVQFDAPADFDPALPVEIDSAPVVLTDLNGEELSGAWKAGAPVTLTRRGGQAFLSLAAVELA